MPLLHLHNKRVAKILAKTEDISCSTGAGDPVETDDCDDIVVLQGCSFQEVSQFARTNLYTYRPTKTPVVLVNASRKQEKPAAQNSGAAHGIDAQIRARI